MSPSERIAIVTTSYPASAEDASGHFVATEAQNLARSGHAVTVLGAGGAWAAEAGVENPSIVRLWDGGATGWPGLPARLRERPSRGLGLVAWGLGVRRELARRGPFQRVIGHWLVPTGFPVLLSSEVGDAAVEVVVHGSDARLVAALPRALGRRLILALSRRARLRCVSHELRALLQDVAGQTLEGRLFVEPAAIDTSAAPTRAAARAQLELSEDTRLIVVVSRLVSGKGIERALAAAALLPHARVVVVGDGPERARLEATTHAGCAKPCFVGRVGRARALTWIAAADVLLSASRLEGAPTVVREARALGVPVVASACGDLASWAELDPELWVLS